MKPESRSPRGTTFTCCPGVAIPGAPGLRGLCYTRRCRPALGSGSLPLAAEGRRGPLGGLRPKQSRHPLCSLLSQVPVPGVCSGAAAAHTDVTHTSPSSLSSGCTGRCGGAFLCRRDAWHHSSWRSPCLACSSVVTLAGKSLKRQRLKPQPAEPLSGTPDKHLQCGGRADRGPPHPGSSPWEQAQPQGTSSRGPETTLL